LDAVLFRELPYSDYLAVYDISDQMFAACGGRNLTSDMEKISGRHLLDPRWYGGEFVMGSAAVFSQISQYIEVLWPDYIRHILSLHHVGDEMIMSTALNVARADGVRTIDYGEAGLVARWWTSRTRHRQLPFDAVEDAALLHLPADKEFLAKEAGYHFDREAFLSRFRRYAQKKIVLRAAVGACEFLLGRPKKFTPRLSSRPL
jgi:hypothetical protein